MIDDTEKTQRKKADWDQEDVLKHKDHVTQGSRGLQIWGDEGAPDMEQTGTASQGTAERQAAIGRGQEAQAEARKMERRRGASSGEEGDSVGSTPDRSREQPT